MNQYCRYCNHAFLQGDDDIWCEEKDEIREGRQVTRMNHCPMFEFNEIDVLYPERVYKPRQNNRSQVKSETDMEQINLFGGLEWRKIK